MRASTLLLSGALAALVAPAGAGAQSFASKDWQVVCDNTRVCRAAGYSAEGSEHPVSLLVARAPGRGQPVVVELQLGTLDARAVHPASVALVGGGKGAAVIRIDRDNHAELAPAVVAALLRTLAAGNDVAFSAGRTTWHVSGEGAVEALQQMDDVQGRTGRPSALVRRGGGSDADVALPMALPRLESVRIPTVAQPGDDALAVRVLASIQSNPDCPLLDDGAAQSRARLWHLDANRLLVTQACRAGTVGSGHGYWIANQRPPYDAKPVTFSGADYDGTGTLTARSADGAAGDCGSAQSWSWNGFRFEQTRAATFGLCRGVKAGGAWELPSLVTDVIPAN